jgi:hypothetical protein
MANHFLIRVTLVATLFSVAHAGTCGDSVGDGTNVAITDAMCQAAEPAGAAARSYAFATPNTATATCDGDDANAATTEACDLSAQASFDACCYIPDCTDDENAGADANDFTCLAGERLVDAAATTPQDGTSATCCEPKVAADCNEQTQFFCAEFAGTATDACTADGTVVGDACNLCPSQMNEPAVAFPNDGEAVLSCLDNICTEPTVEVLAAMGVAIAGLTGNPTTMTGLIASGSVEASAGWMFQTLANAGATATASCTGTVTSDASDCVNVAAFVASGAEADCPTTDGCFFAPAASIACPEGTGQDGTASGGPFVVTGAVGHYCALPTTVPAGGGVVISGMTCENMQTGQIACSVPHTCDTTTHHASSTGIDFNGPDDLPGNSDDGVKCLSATPTSPASPATLELVVSATTTENPAGCSINQCSATAVTTGYTVSGNAALTIVTGLGDVACDTGTDYSEASTEFWGVAVCTGTVDAAVEGKVTGATADCPTWPAWVRTNQPADCPSGCTYAREATVTCAQSSAEAAGTNPFVYSGCTQAKCNDIGGDGVTTTDPFASCSKGMTIKGDLEVACADGTCDTWDCCTEDDGCAAIANPGFDGVAANDDDGKGPCFGTNSACVDVPAPGVGNTCTCCDNDLFPSQTAATEANGGCEGAIGYFGADVTSADADSSAAVTLVQGSCTACTPIANSRTAAQADTPADELVHCLAADNSRAVACVTGSIHVDNTANAVSDVCRLECPFTEVVALIDRLHIGGRDLCAAVLPAMDGTPTEAAQVTACEAVEGCYYKPGTDAAGNAAPVGQNDDVAAVCAPIYSACNNVVQLGDGTKAACEDVTVAGISLSGANGELTSFTDVDESDDVAACTFSDPDGNPGNVDDTCLYTPPASAYDDTITRCQALLDTNWAHDLRDSCDATRACPLHGLASADPPGMIAMVKEVYSAAGVAPDATSSTGTWADGLQSNYFTDDGDQVSMSHWEICMNIRDAVLAAPTCSAGAGR